MKFSVIIPAHNEELFIGDCLASIKKAQEHISDPVEIIVCINRCTDLTEEISRQHGARIVKEDAKNLSKIRNAGAKVATGKILLTIDADSRMSPNTFLEIDRLMSSKKYIGGGTKIKPERLSMGIIFSSLIILFFAFRYGFHSAGLFWCHKKDFDEIRGFDESLVTLEDLDFATRLSALGKSRGLKYGTTWRAHIITSCRKFDKFGDWYFFRNPGIVRSLFSGVDTKSASKFYYDIKR